MSLSNVLPGGGLPGEEDTLRIDRERLVPGLWLELEELLDTRDASVGDSHVKTSELLDSARDSRPNLQLIGDVRECRKPTPAPRLHLVHHRSDVRLSPRNIIHRNI